MKDGTATYFYKDLPSGQRIHHWGGPPKRWAVGNGPIEYVTEQVFYDIWRGESIAAYEPRRGSVTAEQARQSTHPYAVEQFARKGIL